MRIGRTLGVVGVAALLGGSGTLHLVSPRTYERIVPRVLGHPHELVTASGVAELVCAALLLPPRTRRFGGWTSAALLVAVFPANVQMALDGGVRGAGFPFDSAVIAWARLPVQPLLVWWALVASGALDPAASWRERLIGGPAPR
ncbi:MAG: membrane protein [Candidatus Dormibacteria bacterium]